VDRFDYESPLGWLAGQICGRAFSEALPPAIARGEKSSCSRSGDQRLSEEA
jgi:hypothetical protein